MLNIAARLVTHLPVRTPRKEIFKQIAWLTVNQLIFYHTALSTYRIRQSEEPEYLSSIMNRNNMTERIIVSNTSLTLAKNSFCFRGSAQWNSLPGNLRKLRKIGQFKVQLKKWIFLNVAQFINT